MAKNESSGAMMIQNYVGDVWIPLVACDRNTRKKRLLVNGCVDRDDAFSTAGEQ